MKYDSLGNQKWAVQYNGTANLDDYATAITVDKMGFVYVTGYSKTISSEDDIVTIKYNSSGGQEWINTYNSPDNSEDGGIDLVADDVGNVYVAGESYSFTTDYDFITIKYNFAGNQQWVQKYDGPAHFDEAMKKIGLDKSGNIIISGESFGIGSQSDFATIKYSTDGVQQWLARFNSHANFQDIPSDMKIDSIGNIYVTGQSRALDDQYKIVTVKYNNNGVEQWNTIEDKGNYGVGRSLALDHSGNVYTSGYEFINSYAELVTLKYNSFGARIWRINYNYNSNSNNYSSGIVTDNNGNVYVAGTCNDDFVTIKYSQTVDINSTNTQIPEKYFLSQNYPNPFNPMTTIKYGTPKSGLVQVKIYDILGKEVMDLVNENKIAGNYQVNFNGVNYSSGIYFYRIKIDDFVDSKRMVLLK